MAPDIKCFLTVSLICTAPVSSYALAPNSFKIIILILNALRAAQAYPNVLNVHSKYGVSCSVYIT
jgi:hypothetical protein